MTPGDRYELAEDLEAAASGKHLSGARRELDALMKRAARALRSIGDELDALRAGVAEAAETARKLDPDDGWVGELRRQVLALGGDPEEVE